MNNPFNDEEIQDVAEYAPVEAPRELLKTQEIMDAYLHRGAMDITMIDFGEPEASPLAFVPTIPEGYGECICHGIVRIVGDDPATSYYFEGVDVPDLQDHALQVRQALRSGHVQNGIALIEGLCRKLGVEE